MNFITTGIQNKRKHRSKFQPHFAIGGRNTEPGEFPHMVSQQRTLISIRLVIDTMHYHIGPFLYDVIALRSSILSLLHLNNIDPSDPSLVPTNRIYFLIFFFEFNYIKISDKRNENHICHSHIRNIYILSVIS